MTSFSDAVAGRFSPKTLAWLLRHTPAPAVRALVAHRFRHTVRYVAKHSPFYRKAFAERNINPRKIHKPSDLGDFYTTPDDIVKNPTDFICKPPAIVFESSGTSGKNKQIYYDHKELADLGACMSAGLHMLGIRPTDRVANGFDFSIWIPGMLCHYGLMHMKSFCLAFGKVDPIEVYRRLEQYKFNVVMGEPTWLIRLTDLAEKHGAFPLKLLIGGAEEMPADAIPWIQRVWKGAKVKMNYGSVELGGSLGFQPCDQLDGYHLDAVDYLPEILSPDADGYGELVFTTLNRHVMPLLRYRTRDVLKIHSHQCPCGLPTPIGTKLRGRTDEMVVASGGNLYPLLFENALQGVPGLTHDWQVIFRLEGVREVMEINVESGRPDTDNIETDIRRELTDKYPDLMKNLALAIFQMRINVHAPATLRNGRKLKRLVDLRHYAPAQPADETAPLALADV